VTFAFAAVNRRTFCFSDRCNRTAEAVAVAACDSETV
jgi:hypothetical protein